MAIHSSTCAVGVANHHDLPLSFWKRMLISLFSPNPGASGTCTNHRRRGGTAPGRPRHFQRILLRTQYACRMRLGCCGTRYLPCCSWRDQQCRLRNPVGSFDRRHLEGSNIRQPCSRRRPRQDTGSSPSSARTGWKRQWADNVGLRRLRYRCRMCRSASPHRRRRRITKWASVFWTRTIQLCSLSPVIARLSKIFRSACMPCRLISRLDR